ncbi:hypothetical protein BGZ94_007392, partial [Podila epigama]
MSIERALAIAEVATLIRCNLRGYDLKSCVQTCRSWWKIFAPYLWENIYIDNYDDDRTIIFRNGLAARSMTISLYDPLDSKGMVYFLGDNCRNVSTLHLKLFSKGLLQPPTQQSHMTPIDLEEGTTPLLDSLFCKLQYVSQLTLSIATNDLDPRVIFCASKLPRLRSLNLFGGLTTSKYIVRKNRRCDWSIIIKTVLACPKLETLNICWDNPLDTSSIQITGQIGDSHPCYHTHLRSLRIHDCHVQDQELCAFIRSCPKLQMLSLKGIQSTSSSATETCITTAVDFCRKLRSLTVQDPQTGFNNPFASILKTSSSLQTLVLSSWCQPSTIFDGLESLPYSVTTLDLQDISHFGTVRKVLNYAKVLTHLTLRGRIRSRDIETIATEPEEAEQSYEYYFQSQSGNRCHGNLQYLDISHLDLSDTQDEGDSEYLFSWIQNCKPLRRLELNFGHICWAILHDTWDRLSNLEVAGTPARNTYVHPRWCEYHRLVEERHLTHLWHPEAAMPPRPKPPLALTHLDRRFRLFPAVELLVVLEEMDGHATRKRTLDEHMASALIRAMPSLKTFWVDDRLMSQLRRNHIKMFYPGLNIESI